MCSSSSPPRFIVNFSSLLAGAAPASRPIAVAVSTRAADAASADETRRKNRRRRGKMQKKRFERQAGRRTFRLVSRAATPWPTGKTRDAVGDCSLSLFQGAGLRPEALNSIREDKRGN